MSCLNLKRLLPKKKVWKVITNKLHLKFGRSKTNQKLKLKSYKTSSKKVSWPSLSIQPKKFKKQPNHRTIIHHKSHRCYSERRPPPVFVDHLYVQPVSIVTEHVISPCMAKSESSYSSVKMGKNLDSPATGKGESGLLASGQEETRVLENDDGVNADDAWESMLINSPQMDGINERAEEFIARFRAEMRDQEAQARRL